MNSSQLFGITMLCYLLSSAFYLGLLLFRNKKVGTIGLFLATNGVVVRTVALGLRWKES